MPDEQEQIGVLEHERRRVEALEAEGQPDPARESAERRLTELHADDYQKEKP